MAKWADYLVSAIRKDLDGSEITHLRVHEDKKDTVATPKIWTRQQVIDAIEKKYDFITIYKNGDKWNKGEKIHVITVNGVKYLRTDANHTASDNLGNLPEF